MSHEHILLPIMWHLNFLPFYWYSLLILVRLREVSNISEILVTLHIIAHSFSKTHPKFTGNMTALLSNSPPACDLEIQSNKFSIFYHISNSTSVLKSD